MSKDNVVDHLCNKLHNFRNEDEHFDISHSSEHLNSIDKLNLSNTDNFKTSTMLTSTDDTFDKEIIGIDIVNDSSQLTEAECRFVIEKIGSNETILNSQDEKLLYKLIEKMNDYNFSTDTELLDLNTQQFMELHLKRALQLLSAFSRKLDLNSTKTHSIKQIDSDNSFVISPLPLISELRNVEVENKNSSIVNDPKKSEKFSNPSHKIDLKLSSQDQFVEYPSEDQDSEIIAFRAMCEALLKIEAVDNNIIDNKIMKKNNQLNNYVIKQVKHSIISFSNSTEYVLSTSKLNSFKGANDISKRLVLKRHQTNDLRFDSSDDSSSEYSNDLSSKEYNSKSKSNIITFPEDNLKINSKRYSDKTVIQSKSVKKIKLSDLSSGDRDVNCMLTENKLPKVQNVTNDLKCKNLNGDSLEQNKSLKENHTIFYFSSSGKVNNDMLNSIKKKKIVIRLINFYRCVI